MGKKKSTFRIITRVAVLLPSVFCAFMAVAQTSLPDRLTHILETQDMEMGIKLYNEITEADLRNLPDSALLDYNYIGAWVNSEFSNHEKAISHFLEAKRLFESSVGILCGGYMEVMKGLGDEYVELGQCEEALGIYEEGIIKTLAVQNSNPKEFANLTIGAQICCEKLGKYSEIPFLLISAWELWPKDEPPLRTYSYFPLWSLEQYFGRYGNYEAALAISDRIESFIVSQGGSTHAELCQSLYMKGNILVKANKSEEAISCYEKALSLAKSNNLNTEITELLYSNLFMTLISVERYDESGKVLDCIKEYSEVSNHPECYKRALFSAAYKAFEMGDYAKAVSYNKILLELDINDEEKLAIENQRNEILNNQDVVENLSGLEAKFYTFPTGSSDWFETGCKLSNGFYLLKDFDKSSTVLIKMYNAIDVNKSIGTDYYLEVISNLYELSLDKEEYQDAFKYADEKWKYLSRLSDVTEIFRYNALNSLVVAKMRSNNLDGIDSDLEKIENFYRVQYGALSNEYAIYLHNRGRAYQLQNKLEEAKETLLRSITLQNKLVGRPLERTVRYYMEVEQQLGEL